MITVLILCMAFVPAVNAQAEYAKYEKDVSALFDEYGITSEEFKSTVKEAKLLMDTDNQKLYSIEKDGDVGYVYAWKDATIEGRVNFAFISEKELLQQETLSDDSLSSKSFENTLVTYAKGTFWHGSYYQSYGNSITGGVDFHLVPLDAEMVSNGVSVIGGASLAVILGLAFPAIGAAGGAILAPVLTVIIRGAFWAAQNNDGSLDLRITYASAYVAVFGASLQFPGITSGYVIIAGISYLL
jgi:hypothetical protein